MCGNSNHCGENGAPTLFPSKSSSHPLYTTHDPVGRHSESFSHKRLSQTQHIICIRTVQSTLYFATLIIL